MRGAYVVVTVAAETAAVVLQPTYLSVLFGLYSVTIVTIGVLIAARRRGRAIARILIGFGLVNAIPADLISHYGTRAAAAGWPGGPLGEAIGFGTWSAGALMWVIALLFIPTGRLPGPRWASVIWLGCAGDVLFNLGWLTDPANGAGFVRRTNPWAIPGLPHQALVVTGAVLLCAAMVASLVSLVRRYRRSGPVERRQLKWVALSGQIIIVLLPVCVAFWAGSPLIQAVTPVALIVAALGLAAAVLRYRLFDVDLIVNRTVVYLSLSILLAVAYGVTAIVAGALLGGYSSWTAAGATLVAAVAFGPLRRAVQKTVDRRFEPEKHEARVRIDDFLERLRAGTEQPDRVEELLRDVLGDPSLRVLLLLPASGDYSDIRGNPITADPARPVIRLDRAGLVEYAPSDDPGRPVAVRKAVERSRLALEIARLGVDLNRSRARLVSAADDERRRIQRDLHDGAQQRLVTVGMVLRAMESRQRADGRADEADRLDGAVAGIAATIEELRDLAAQLPIAQLDAGIGAAFRELAERAPLAVAVDVPVDRLDRSLEATAYFVGCEGLTNVIKHARASAATLRAVRRDGSLVVTVADNGVGGAQPRPGSGLTGLADRVQAAGGRFRVLSDPTGTMLTAEFPCG